jgi:Tfp pilus assembly protein PilF
MAIDIRETVLAALRHHQAGRKAEAVQLVDRLLAEDPDQPQALLLLGIIRAEGPDLDGAEDLFRRYLKRHPGDALALHNLGKLRQRRGDDAQAVEFFTAANVQRQDFAPNYNDLGASLHRLGRREAALAAFDRAVAIDAAYATALCNRGLLLVEMRRGGEAAKSFQQVLALTADSPSGWHNLGIAHFNLDQLDQAEAACRRALALDPAFLEAYLLLAQTLERAHRPDEAQAVRTQWACRQGVLVKPCLGGTPEARILLIGGAGLCNVPTDYLLDRRRFEITVVHVLPPSEPEEDFAATLARTPPFDVAFNAVGDADRGSPFLERVANLCRRVTCPILNPPGRIPPTRRDHLPVLLNNIDGLVIPAVTRVAREEARHPGGRPLLVRPVGSHGGLDLERVEDEAQLQAHIAKVPSDAYYLTDFWDYRSPDGAFRKYRLVFIGGEVFPYHLAIANDWLVHYWRAAMTEPFKREEEAFLADWRSAFPGRLGAAVETIAARLDLDYGGIDCSITRDGRLLLFEANATMLVHLADSPEEFAYKHRYVPRIVEAMSGLVARRIAGAA